MRSRSERPPAEDDVRERVFARFDQLAKARRRLEAGWSCSTGWWRTEECWCDQHNELNRLNSEFERERMKARMDHRVSVLDYVLRRRG